jgi:hypothetical protein
MTPNDQRSGLWAVLGIAKSGDVSCGPLTCDQIERVSAEIEWAESMFEDTLNKYDKSLVYKPRVVQADSPYLWLPSDMLLGSLSSYTLTADVDTQVGDTFSTLTFAFGVGDFDSACDRVLGVVAVWPDNTDVATRMQPKWKTGPTATIVDGEFTLTTDTMAIQEVSCGDGTAATPTSVSLVVTVLKPSLPRMTYYTGGCPDPDTVCDKCGGKASCEGCYVDGGQRVWRASFVGAGALCACRGRFAYYEFDTVASPIDLTVSVMDAIISLANTRGTINECADCTSAATERVKRDLGIIPTIDLRQVTLYAFSNPFGIYAAGALSAWRVLERLVAGVGGAGVM